MRYLIITLCLLPLLCVAAIYKSTDKQGNPIFSDQPSPNAQQINLKSPQTFEQTNAPESAQALSQPLSQPKDVSQYTSLELTQPEHNSTFWSGDGPISVKVKLQPALQQGDQAVLIYDGEAILPITGPTADVSFSLSSYQPGKHRLSVEIRQTGDPAKVLKMSNGVTIFVLVHRNKAN